MKKDRKLLILSIVLPLTLGFAAYPYCCYNNAIHNQKNDCVKTIKYKGEVLRIPVDSGIGCKFMYHPRQIPEQNFFFEDVPETE